MTTATTEATTEPKVTIETLTFPLAEAIAAFSAVLPHASKDDMRPVICAAMVTHEYVIATDRYSVGRWTWHTGIQPNVSDDVKLAQAANNLTTEIVIPCEAVEWVTKIALAKLRHTSGNSSFGVNLYALTITKTVSEDHKVQDDITLAITFSGKVERSQAFDVMVGNYPPVNRLLEDWEPADNAVPVGIEPSRLERVTTFAKRTYKEQPVKMEIGKTSNPSKPGPMRLTIDQLTAIIQPESRI